MQIAQSRLYGQRRGIRRKAIQVAIGSPVANAHGDVSCAVHISGIDPPRKIYGIDSLQALALSINFLGQRLESLQSSGWRFYFAREDSESCDPRRIWFPETGHTHRKRPTSSSTQSRTKTGAPRA